MADVPSLKDVLNEEPKIVTVSVGIEGLPPGMYQGGKGLMEEDEKCVTRPARTPAEEAKLRAHWCRTGRQKNPSTPCIPWVCLFNSLVAAGNNYKIAGQGQKRWSGLLAATVSCPDDNIPLLAMPDRSGSFAEYVVKEDWVRIPPKTGAMVKVGRPHFPAWCAEFGLNIDASTYNKTGVEMVAVILANAGKMVGLGPWRPQLKGPHGKFRVTKFDIHEAAQSVAA